MSTDPRLKAAGRQAFVDRFASQTHLNRGVVAAWVQAEGADAPNGTGHFNYLNVKAKPDGTSYSGVPLAGVSANGFQQFINPQDAATEAAYWINRMGNYAGIRNASRKPPAAQLAAITRSPWDAGHYRGGRTLLDAYKKVASGKSAADIVEDAPRAIVEGVVHVPIPGRDTADAILHPGRTAEHVASFALEGLLRIVLILVVLALAAALFYNGVRRLSGDRLPSGGQLAGGARGMRAPLSPEAAAVFA